MQQMGHAIYERYREQEAKAYTIENLQGKSFHFCERILQAFPVLVEPWKKLSNG